MENKEVIDDNNEKQRDDISGHVFRSVGVSLQQSSADEVVVRASQVVKKKRESLDCCHSHHLLLALQRLGKHTHTPRLAHATMYKGQQ